MAAMRRNKNETVSQPEEKVLDVNATMQGALRFDDPVNLRISGKFEGTLDTKGKLMIGNKAVIKANITGEEVQIEGAVAGNIKATEVVKLTKTARLTGDVETPRLSIEDGAVLLGHGLPYWILTAAFLFVHINLIDDTDNVPARLDRKRALIAATIAVLFAIAVALVFEKIFLVRLP